MSKTWVTVVIMCLGFTAWWAWELDSSFFIYRHTVPDKLNQHLAETFMPYFQARQINSIRFGDKNKHPEQKTAVTIKANNATKTWHIHNSETGPVQVNTNRAANTLTVHWDIPADTRFNESFNLLSTSLWDILYQYDQIQTIQYTYQ